MERHSVKLQKYVRLIEILYLDLFPLKGWQINDERFCAATPLRL